MKKFKKINKVLSHKQLLPIISRSRAQLFSKNQKSFTSSLKNNLPLPSLTSSNASRENLSLRPKLACISTTPCSSLSNIYGQQI